jgi:pseudouridine-5'-phosphate glycosidase
VHRGARGTGSGSAAGPAAGSLASTPTFDISSDLEELARTPVAVVCAGPKAILDVPATLEYLETRGVPVVAVGQGEMPGFFARSAGIAAPHTVPDIGAAAELVGTHLGLGLGSGLLICVAVPAADALPEAIAREAVQRAIDEARDAGVTGPALTPWLLGRIAQLTDGASIRANTSLIVNDARVAGALATHLATSATGR